MDKRDSIIVLAWPDTPVVSEGKWYDVPMRWIGVLQGRHYKAGHSAAILVNHRSGDLQYFDFGRYHTPRQTGRVRDQFTDPDVTIATKAIISTENETLNLEDIILEVASNPSTHGKGRMLASVYTGIDFRSAAKKAKNMQDQDAISYGPFVYKGTNCSRFVAVLAKAGKPGWLVKLALSVPYTTTPTPVSNIRIISNAGQYYEVEGRTVLRKYRIMKRLANKLRWQERQPEMATNIH